MNHAIILLAGEGKRFGKEDKSLTKINGCYMYEYILNTLLQNKRIDTITLVVKKSNIEKFGNLIAKINSNKLINVVAGNKTHRMVSLSLGFSSIKRSANDIIITLDGDRPFVSNKLINKSIDIAKNHGFSTACLPVYDSIIQSTKYVDRKLYQIIQTPQSFVAKRVNKNYKKDKSDLVSCMGWSLKRENLFVGEHINFKITTQEDLLLAKKIIPW